MIRAILGLVFLILFIYLNISESKKSKKEQQSKGA